MLGIAPTLVAAADASGWALSVPAVLVACWAVLAAFPANPVVRPQGFLALLVVGLGVLAGLRGAGATLYAATLPLFWFHAPTGRRAMAFGGAAAVATVTGDVVHSGGSLHLRDGNVLVTLAACAAGLALGLWIPRLIEYGERRAARLAAELEAAQRDLVEAHQRRGAAEERERMAREIHDTLAQGFASIIVLAEATRSDLTADPAKAAQQLLSIERTARENFTPRVAQRLVARLRRPTPVVLTPRETDVLAGVAEGLSNADIARRLVIGEATVKTHLLRIFAKLDVSDRTHAVVVALERGLLTRPQRPLP